MVDGPCYSTNFCEQCLPGLKETLVLFIVSGAKVMMPFFRMQNSFSGIMIGTVTDKFVNTLERENTII